MKSEDGAVLRGYSCTTPQRKRIPAERFRARGTSFAHTHLISGPLNRMGNRKQQTRVLPVLRDRKEKLHPLKSGVKLATHREMRHPSARRQRGKDYAQSVSTTSCQPGPPRLGSQEATLYSGKR